MKLHASLLILLATACAQPNPVSMSEVEIQGSPGTSVSANGITVLFDETILYRSVSTSAPGVGSSSEMTVNGLPYEFDGKQMRLGSLTLDGFQEGDEIQLSTRGILVNGEKRAEFPTN